MSETSERAATVGGRKASGARAEEDAAEKTDEGLPPELLALWDTYKATADPQSREKLILHYAPLVKYVSSRVATGLPSTIEHGDLTSYGMFGLIDALDKFDLERGIKFETYAIPRIKGAILDELRAMDWVPRSVRAKARQVEKAYTELEAAEKRAPSEQEVATKLGVTMDELHDLINQISFVNVMALDEALTVGKDRGEQVTLMDTLADVSVRDPLSNVEDEETRAMLGIAVNQLGEREKVVLTLYYFEGLTLAEIGDILGVTESRICQIHTKAVSQLRVRLREVDGPA